MEQLIDFIGNHLFLCAAFAIVAAMLTQNLLADMGSKERLEPRQVTEMINQGDPVLIDVRPTADFNRGHIVGAKSIPMSSLTKQLGPLEKHKKDPVIICCRTGAQSVTACKEMRKAGFEKVFDLRGGIMAWQNANMPTSKK